MNRRRNMWKLMPVVRAVSVLSAVGVITTLVTFSALQSTGNALTGNTIETATASLQISKDGTGYADSTPGYDFNNIVPGGSAQPTYGNLVYVKNVGTTNLVLSLTIPTPPNLVGISDLSRVHLLVTPKSGTGGPFTAQDIKFSDLVAGKVPLVWGTNHGLVQVGSTATFGMQVSMDIDAVNSSSASIAGLDLSFSGTPQ